MFSKFHVPWYWVNTLKIHHSIRRPVERPVSVTECVDVLVWLKPHGHLLCTGNSAGLYGDQTTIR